jgi:uncharacterized protein (UPF0276 family)
LTTERARIPRLGPGAVYLRALDPLFRAHPDLIRVAEIEPATLWVRATAPDAAPRGSLLELQALASLPQARLLHGVGYPLGGTICDQERHVGEFRRWARALDAPWQSEHLSVLDLAGARGAVSCGFLMPPLQTEAGVEIAAANIVRRRAALGWPLAFETGVSYFASRAGEMADGAFFAAVAEAADCGILLDLANLTVNERNGRDPVEKVLAELPLDRVWEVHLAGSEFAHGYWLDAHCGAADPELAALAADVVADLPNLGAIIFEVSADRMPGFGEAAFLRQMETLSGLWDVAGSGRSAPRHARARRRPLPATVEPADWEALIAARMLPPAHRPPVLPAMEVLDDSDAFALYAILVAAFRRGAVVDLLENAVRLLLTGLGEAGLQALFDRHFAETPPSLYPSDEALAFAAFLETTGCQVPGLDDMAAFEAGVIRAAADDRPVRVRLRRPLDALLTAAAAGLPVGLPEGPAYELEIGGAAGLRLVEPRPEWAD